MSLEQFEISNPVPVLEIIVFLGDGNFVYVYHYNEKTTF